MLAWWKKIKNYFPKQNEQAGIYKSHKVFSVNSKIPHFFKENEMCRACSTNGEKRNACRILVGKPEGKRLGRPRLRWVDNITIDLTEMGWIWLKIGTSGGLL
jgi:hypothetical protein